MNAELPYDHGAILPPRMPVGLRGDPSTMRRVNRALIGEALRTHGPQSRADLARQTHMSAPTVSAIVGDMLDEGLLSLVGSASGKRGRPADLVAFSDEAVLVGCDLAPGHVIHIATVSLTGSVTDLETSRLPEEISVEFVSKALEEFMARGDASGRDAAYLGVGISVPGIVSPNDGTVVSSPSLDWRDVHLADVVGQWLDLPVLVENDANAMLEAELRSGAARTARHAALILMGDLIEGAIAIDRRVYRGRGRAGEVGFSIVHATEPDVEYRDFGALERGVFDLLAGHLGHEVVDEELLDLHTASLAERLIGPNERLELTGRDRLRLVGMLAAACANVSTLLDPDLLIMSGWIESLEEGGLLVEVADLVGHLVPDPSPIVPGELGDYGPIIGSALTVADYAIRHGPPRR